MKLDHKNMTIDQVQFVSSKGAILHPILYVKFIESIMELDRKGKVCALPITRLQRFNLKIKKKIA